MTSSKEELKTVDETVALNSTRDGEHLREVKIESVELDNTSSAGFCSPLSSSSVTASTKWKFFGEIVPKSEVVYLCQIFIIFFVLVSCVVNLSLKNGNSEMWVSIFGYAFGAMLPPPKMKLDKNFSPKTSK